MIKSLTRITFQFTSNIGKIIFFGSDKVGLPTAQSLTQHFKDVDVVTYKTDSKRKLTNDV